jgi:CRISPR-associated protein Cas2
MWVMTMFDLPVHDREARKRYARFRKKLIRFGFNRVQFSVYARGCSSKENAEVHMARVEKAVPEEGEVRVLMVTDKQYQRMKIFWGQTAKPAEKPPEQLLLF